MKMLRAKQIYLDQKDYGRIALGLLGNEKYKPDLHVYEYLLSLVRSGNIKIYFSWCHLNEGLKWYGNSELLNAYCEVVDNLTQGDCVILPSYLERRELELFLANEYGFATDLSQDTYAYGRDKDAVFIDEDFGISIAEEFIEEIKRNIRNDSQLRGQQKKYILRKLEKKKNQRKLLESLPDSVLEITSLAFPGADKINKMEFIELITGSKIMRRKLLDKFFSGFFTFKNLILSYRKRFPQLEHIGQMFDEDSKKLSKLIKSLQILQTYLNKQPFAEEDLESDLTNLYVMKLDKNISELGKKYDFSPEHASHLLIKSKLEPIPSLRSIVLFVVEYYAKNKGDVNHARNPLDSDLMDLQHLNFIPYVDYFLTDRFFKEVASRPSSQFNTLVFRNLSALKEHLEKLCGD